MKTATSWPPINDEAFVERLLPALQQAIIGAIDSTNDDGWKEVPAGDLANAFLILLASLLEGSPMASNSSGMRLMADAAGKELHALIKDARRLREVAARDPGSVQ